MNLLHRRALNACGRASIPSALLGKPIAWDVSLGETYILLVAACEGAFGRSRIVATEPHRVSDDVLECEAQACLAGLAKELA